MVVACAIGIRKIEARGPFRRKVYNLRYIGMTVSYGVSAIQFWTGGFVCLAILVHGTATFALSEP